MTTRFSGRQRSAWSLLALLALLGTSCGPKDDAATSPSTPDASLSRGQGPDLRAALAAQARHTDRLLKQQDIVGTAVGLSADGRPVVQVFTKAARGGLPAALDGVPVELKVTGELRAILPKARPGGGEHVDPTSRFARPVPIGVSTGNVGECSAGTIGARVLKGGTAYALSNNHVYALENDAANGSNVLQPGRYDTNCATNAVDVIGSLSSFVPITFSTSANNRVDVAIAQTTTTNVSNATPSNGYGQPAKTTVAASLNQLVQKYGRTTGLTHGVVSGVNATVNVGYSSGTARFTGQIIIDGTKGSFSRAGDSGSLIVTDNAGANPVGLLFAGSNTITVANPIGEVLAAVNATIDGK